MTEEQLRLCNLSYELGRYFLRTENGQLSLYFVIATLTKTNKEYIPKKLFLDQAFEFGLQQTTDKEHYQKELYSVDERKAFYKRALSKTESVKTERSGAIQFRSTNNRYIQSRTN
jgi:hypothetical protein